MAAFPSVEDFRAWVRVDGRYSGDMDTAALEAACAAAEAAMTGRLTLPEGTAPLPGDLVLAYYLRAARYLARRSSPDGLVGFGDAIGRVGRFDADIDALEGPWRPVVWS